MKQLLDMNKREENMKNIFRKMILVTLCMVLVGCGKTKNVTNSTDKKADVPMGRYVEQSVGLDEQISVEGDAYLWVDHEGKLQALVHSKQFISYELQESGQWQQVESKLCEVINNKYPEIIDIYYLKPQATEGKYYLYGERQEGKKKHRGFIATFDGNELTEIDMGWQEKEPILFGLTIDDEGNIIFGNFEEECIQIYDTRGNLQHSIGEGVMTLTLVGDKIIALGWNKVEVYNRNNYIKEQTIDKISSDPKRDKIFSNGIDTVFIATSEGVFSLKLESDILEKIIEGDFCCLSSYYPEQTLIYEDKIFIRYTKCDKADRQCEILKKYSYDKNVPTVPDKKITVWAVAPQFIQKDAFTYYKEVHPDIYIEYETLYTDEQYDSRYCEVRSEDLEILNTQILVGEGPDLFFLKGLPVEAYRKQGVFADLTEPIHRVMQEEEMLENIVTGYCEEGEIYAVPLNFELIRAVGKKELLENGFNLKDVVAYQEKHPNEMVMFPVYGAARTQQLANLMQSQLFDTEGRVNKEAMTELLYQINKVQDGKGYGVDWQMSTALLSDMMKVDIETVDSIRMLQSMYYVTEQVPDTVIMDQIGQYQNIAYGTNLIAINRNSKNKKTAEEILQVALSSETQGGEGLPVNLTALTELLLYNNHSKNNWMMYYLYKEPSDEGIMYDLKDFDFGYPEEMKKCLEECKNTTFLKPLNSSIQQILVQESEPYFVGMIGLDEAVNNIERKVNLYISENQ